MNGSFRRYRFSVALRFVWKFPAWVAPPCASVRFAHLFLRRVRMTENSMAPLAIRGRRWSGASAANAGSSASSTAPPSRFGSFGKFPVWAAPPPMCPVLGLGSFGKNAIRSPGVFPGTDGRNLGTEEPVPVSGSPLAMIVQAPRTGGRVRAVSDGESGITSSRSL